MLPHTEGKTSLGLKGNPDFSTRQTTLGERGRERERERERGGGPEPNQQETVAEEQSGEG